MTDHTDRPGLFGDVLDNLRLEDARQQTAPSLPRRQAHRNQPAPTDAAGQRSYGANQGLPDPEARRAVSIMNDWTNFWTPIPLPVPRGLAALGVHVLARSEKRSPKWRFRLSDRLVIRAQARVAGRPYSQVFDCKAVVSEHNADKRLLNDVRPKEKDRNNQIEISFLLTADDEGYWCLSPTSVRGGGAERRPEDYQPALEQIVNSFRAGQFDLINPRMMLKPACWYCGKALTDSVSQARGVGPECAGTSSTSMPWTLDLRPKAEPRAAGLK